MKYSGFNIEDANSHGFYLYDRDHTLHYVDILDEAGDVGATMRSSVNPIFI